MTLARVLVCVLLVQPSGAFQLKTFEDAPATRIMYHHIWKCGGTHFCDMARDAGYNTPDNTGCHRWMPGYTANSPPVGLSSDDAELRRWTPCALHGNQTEQHELTKEAFNFYGHECPVNARLIDEGIQAGFQWVVILRSPVEQLVSWYRHASLWDLDVGTKIDHWISMYRNQGLGPGNSFAKFIDNLQTRWLAGAECSITACPDVLVESTQHGVINRQDRAGLCSRCLDIAKAHLRKMNVVLEQKGHSVVGMEKLYAIGWPQPDIAPTAALTDETTSFVATMADSERSLIEKTQSVDMALVEWARAEGIITA